MRYFCPNCWSDFAEDVARCPQCGTDIHAFWDSKDLVDKLILALDHRDHETSIRAAWILGERRETRAVGPLIALIGRTQDVYIARAAARALGEIGTAEAICFLETLKAHPARMVREEARAALKKHAACASGNSSDNHERK